MPRAESTSRLKSTLVPSVITGDKYDSSNQHNEADAYENAEAIDDEEALWLAALACKAASYDYSSPRTRVVLGYLEKITELI